MAKFNLLDCTLRDGGYINKWSFKNEEISVIICGLIQSGLDFVEVGYINSTAPEKDYSQFNTIEKISSYIPKDRKGTLILAMADVEQFEPKDLTKYTGKSIDGIRVVFYKHQIEKAMTLASAVKENGYKLFMQPMVTVDYSVDEYSKLAKRVAELKPYAVSVVDSFGYMSKSDFRRYFKILDNLLDVDVMIGFHSHNNMNLAFITAQDILEYNTYRKLVIDASLYGMGRGAGNLNTELIANYYNMTLGKKYDVVKILDLISKYIIPIYNQKPWGYSPYYFITGLYHCHPNFAAYLLEEQVVSVSDFEAFIHTIPKEMQTKCRKPYVLEMWNKFKS